MTDNHPLYKLSRNDNIKIGVYSLCTEGDNDLLGVCMVCGHLCGSTIKHWEDSGVHEDCCS